MSCPAVLQPSCARVGVTGFARSSQPHLLGLQNSPQPQVLPHPAPACTAWVQPFAGLLPLAVVAPGTPVAPVTPEAAARAGLPQGCLVCGGTTDSIAAFVAAGVTEPGEVSGL